MNPQTTNEQANTPTRIQAIDRIDTKMQNLGLLCTAYDSTAAVAALIRNHNEIPIDSADSDKYYLAFVDRFEKLDDGNWLIYGAIIKRGKKTTFTLEEDTIFENRMDGFVELFSSIQYVCKLKAPYGGGDLSQYEFIEKIENQVIFTESDLITNPALEAEYKSFIEYNKLQRQILALLDFNFKFLTFTHKSAILGTTRHYLPTRSVKINATTLENCKGIELLNSKVIATLDNGDTQELAFSSSEAAMQSLIVKALTDSSDLLDIDTLAQGVIFNL